MNVDLELYKIFYVVAKNKNMTKASEELFISQPAISQAIKKLEEQLGGTLFIRSNKGMELTSEGRMFFTYVTGALELIRNAENEFTAFKELSKGEVKIGISTTLTKLLLMDTIQQFHQDFPNIDIKITNDLTSDLLLDLQKGRLDFVIFAEGDQKENNLSLEKITTLKEGFLYHPDFFTDTISSFEQLNQYPLILQKKESNSRKHLDNLMLQKNLVLHEKMEVVSQDLVIAFTNAGLGIGYTFVSLAQRNFPDLKELSINQEIPKIDVYLATNKSIHLPFASTTFITYLKRCLQIKK